MFRLEVSTDTYAYGSKDGANVIRRMYNLHKFGITELENFPIVTTMSVSFATLPAELYSAILSLVPFSDHQQTVLSLTRALPHSPIPLYHLFEHIRLRHADQVVHLYLRLRKTAGDAAAWVKSFSLETWTVDADVAVNLIRLLPKLINLEVFIGPSFAPEHLEDMFGNPITQLRFLSLRFRP